MKRTALAAFLMVLSLPLMASPGEHFNFGHPAPTAQAQRTVEVNMGDMFFESRALQVKAGETIRFVVHNNDKLAHEFNLGDAAMHARHQQEMLQMQAHAAMGHPMKHEDPNTVLVEPGKTAELTWTFTSAQPLEFACNVPGHYQAGMVGKLAVVK